MEIFPVGTGSPANLLNVRQRVCGRARSCRWIHQAIFGIRRPCAIDRYWKSDVAILAHWVAHPVSLTITDRVQTDRETRPARPVR